jgi:F0F1-type ATP synthase assembly protein I
MSDPSASTELEPADSESPPSVASGDSANGSRDNAARAMALVVGVLVGTFIGVGIGIGLGNAARKRFDRWSRY